VAVLALDTSAAVAVAVTDDSGRTLAALSVVEHRRHAELLAPMIVDTLAQAGVARGDLSAVVVGTGPAPFTGLRVGLVTARTLALALGVPVHGVGSLDALAAGAVRALDLAPGTDVVVVADARRHEVYWARYRVGAPTAAGDPAVELVAGPGVEAPAHLVARGAATGAVVVGRGATLYPDLLTAAAGAPLDPEPADLARLALRRLAADGAPGAALGTEPLYLRRPDAVPPPQRKRTLA